MICSHFTLFYHFFQEIELFFSFYDLKILLYTSTVSTFPFNEHCCLPDFFIVLICDPVVFSFPTLSHPFFIVVIFLYLFHTLNLQFVKSKKRHDILATSLFSLYLYSTNYSLCKVTVPDRRNTLLRVQDLMV